MNAIILLVLVGGVIWVGQRIPLSGRRKAGVIACHVAAVLVVCVALWAPPLRRTQDAARQVVYLVDGSASIDEEQRAWIARRISSLEARRPRRLERAVVVFGRDSEAIVPLGHEPLDDPAALEAQLAAAKVDARETSLEAAVLSSLSIVSSPQRARVILFSDGRETAGNVTGILPFVRRLGLEVYPEAVPVFGRARTVWESVSVPPVVQRGGSAVAQLVIRSAAKQPQAGTVAVTMRGVVIKRQAIVVRPGWQVVNVPVPAIARGTLPLDVQLTIPGEGVSERRQVYTEVEGPPRVLFVTERPGTMPLLAAALKRRGLEITSTRPAELSADPAKLLDADALLFFNVPKSVFSEEQVAALRTYVEASGGGLVTVGLGGDFAHELTTPAPLDALLPVTFEAKGLQEAKRRICIVMLIDRSASMIGPRMAATKRAAIELVKQLQPDDLVGILAFDTQPYVLAEVQAAGQVGEWLIDKLVRLRSTGGTDIYPALTAALNRLDVSDAAVKHVILLSDGNTPFHAKAYEALIDEMKRAGVTVSTIGIGAVFINTDYLRWLAASTGGEYYQMNNLGELPKIVVRDTERALGRLPFAEGFFQPAAPAEAEWFTDVAEWPTLRGYFTATAKPEARIELLITDPEERLPLLARWTVGRGRVASFMSDADARWSTEWIRWPGFEATWAKVVRWAMRPRLTEELFVWMDQHDGIPQAVVEGMLEDPRAELISAVGPTRVPLSLVQTGAWRWQASLEQVPSGWHQLVVESHEQGASVFAKRWVRVGTPPASQEVAGQPPQETLLRHMATATQGVYQAPDGAFLPPTVPTTTTVPMLGWWLPLVIGLLLVEVALRGGSML